MNKPIIVVGMDNTGKTTLCQKLSQRYNYYHLSPCGPGKTRKEMIEHMNTCLILPNLNFIYERFPIFEEMVYGKVLRNKSLFTFRNVAFKRILKLKPLIIYCRPEEKDIFDFGNRKQMEGVVDNSKKLLIEWDNLIYTLRKKFNLEIKTYNYKIDNWENLLK